MSLVAAYLAAIICIILIPLLLTLWTSLKRQRFINQYISDRNSEMSRIIINMQKTIEDYGRQIKERKQEKGTRGSS